MPIEPSLSALHGYKQFILCKLVPTPSGKMDKLPVSPFTLQVCDAHDREHHASFEDAETAAKASGLRVAFVLTETDPFFCVDLDSCYTPAGWSQGALSVIERFPGCAVEVTQSGRGLHIWGTYTSVPSHRCVPDPTRVISGTDMELYHTRRFICLGAPGATGNAWQDSTESLAAFIQERFAPVGGSALPAEALWNDGPVPEWSGPTDDMELINRALRSKESVRSAFGAAASFGQLWFGEEDALAKFYPSESPQKAFNYNEADAALILHLMWWTGRDCPRIQRLMMQSGLKREKFDREDYLPRSIESAMRHIGNKGSVYCETKTVTAEAAPVLGVVSTAERRTCDTFCTLQEQMTMWAGCVYVSGEDVIRLPNGQSLSQSSFNNTYAGRIYHLDDVNDKTTKKAFEAFTGSFVLQWPKVGYTSFRPDLPANTIWAEEDVLFINTFKPPKVERLKGYPGPFLDHLDKLVGADTEARRVILYYLANLAQNPGVKFQWALFLQGMKGNGKSLISLVAQAAVGSELTHWPTPYGLLEDKNEWLANKLLVCVEDVHIPKGPINLMEHMKPMITGKTQSIRVMYQAAKSCPVYCNFLINANDKASLPVTSDERRYYPVYCLQQKDGDLVAHGMHREYFAELYNWLEFENGYAIVSEHLHTLEIPAEYGLRWLKGPAPVSEDFEEAVIESRSSIEQELAEAIEENTPGLRGGWLNGNVVKKVLQQTCRAHITPRRREEAVKQLGFIPHPALGNGYLKNNLPDGSRPKIYAHRDMTLILALQDSRAVKDAYCEAQEDKEDNDGATVYQFSRGGR